MVSVYALNAGSLPNNSRTQRSFAVSFQIMAYRAHNARTRRTPAVVPTAYFLVDKDHLFERVSPFDINSCGCCML